MSDERPDTENGQDSGEDRGALGDLYERMSRVLQEKLERAGSVSEEAFERALRETREWASRMREHYGDDVSRVSESLRRDWLNAVRFTREQTARRFDLDRMQAGVFGLLSRMAQSAGNQLEQWASRLNERLTYHTGEIAGGGTLECTECGRELHFEKAGRVPPCPKCRNTAFRRRF